MYKFLIKQMLQKGWTPVFLSFWQNKNGLLVLTESKQSICLVAAQQNQWTLTEILKTDV